MKIASNSEGRIACDVLTLFWLYECFDDGHQSASNKAVLGLYDIVASAAEEDRYSHLAGGTSSTYVRINVTESSRVRKPLPTGYDFPTPLPHFAPLVVVSAL